MYAFCGLNSREGLNNFFVPEALLKLILKMRQLDAARAWHGIFGLNSLKC